MDASRLKHAPRPVADCNEDVPRILLSRCLDKPLKARLTALEAGVAAGCGAMAAAARELGLEVVSRASSGRKVAPGQALAELAGPALALIRAEDRLLGLVGKYSGVATAAARARKLAGRLRVVCGAWKKMPPELKEGLRRALEAGGIQTRIIDTPFVYLGKNYLRVLGSVRAALEAAGRLPGRETAIQVCGDTGPIHEEARTAAALGARVVFVDTGRWEDLRLVANHLREVGLRRSVELAFAGGVTLADLPELAKLDLDIVDLGRALIDAPLLDCRYQVLP